MAGRCSVSPCPRLHVPKEERPECEAWKHLKRCDRRGECWFPHPIPRTAHDGVVAALQIHSSHAARMADYVTQQYGGVVQATETVRGLGMNRKNDRLLFLQPAAVLTAPAAATPDEAQAGCRAPAVDAALAAIGADPVVAPAVLRCYPVDCVVDTLEEAAAYFRGVLTAMASEAATVTGGDAMMVPPVLPFRTQCFPPSDEIPLAEAIEASPLTLPSGSSVEPQPLMQGWRVLLTCATADGRCYCGAVPSSSPLFYGHTGDNARTGKAVASRAYYKLREVQLRSDLFSYPASDAAASAATASASAAPPSSSSAPSAGKRVGIDVGAAPGGWTQCLLQDCGVDEVIAVDPAELVLPFTAADRHARSGVELSQCLHHMPQKVEAALPLILEERGRHCLHAWVCDMNIPTGKAMSIFMRAASELQLLAPGAAVVITLKNFDGTRAVWQDNCAAAKATMVSVCVPDSVHLVHLMANGLDEVTMWATVR